MNKKKFPVIFGRIGGSNYNTLDNLKCDRVEHEASILLALKTELSYIKKNIIHEIYSIIKGENNPKFKNTLLNLKRDFYNDRNIEKYQTLISTYFELEKDFELFKEKAIIYYAGLNNYKIIFNEEFFGSITKLKGITDLYFFKNGLLFSSHVLSKAIIRNDFNFTKLEKKNKRLLISTLKYLSRSVVKTTPLSSFNNIFCLEYTDKLYVSNNTHTKPSNIQISNLFFYYLKGSLLGNEKFRNKLLVKLNTSMWISAENDKVFNFFTNKNNNETLKKLNKSPILEYLKEKLLKYDLSYFEVIKDLTELTEQSSQNIKNYIETLIDEGFLKINYPVSSSSKNWIEELLNFILSKKEIAGEFEGLVFMLKKIQISISNLENTRNITDRARYIKNSHHDIIQYLASSNSEIDFTKKIPPQDLFFEDTFQKTKSIISSDVVSSSMEALQAAFSGLNNFPYKKTLKKRMGEKLQENFNGKLPILLFYKNIYLKHLNDFSFNDSELIKFKGSIEKVSKVLKENETLSALDLSTVIDQNLISLDRISFGCYIQVTNSNWEKLVLNDFSNGDGSNISRFLNFTAKELSEKVIVHNVNNYPNKILADVKDSSIHNVNTYPPLTDYVISVSQENALKSRYRTIDLSNIYVVYDTHKGLTLKTSKGIEIIPKSFSLEGIERKSKFTQFLDIFNLVDNTGFLMYKQNIGKFYEEKLSKKPIVFIPRIIYGEKIILQRKKWLVKKSVFMDLLDKNWQDHDICFLLINEWIFLNKFPSEVFIKIAEKREIKKHNDDHKPQYINFKSPIFIILFMNLINKSKNIIEFTEMFPNASQIYQNNGFVEEFILNIN